jgi:hypothetical protein
MTDRTPPMTHATGMPVVDNTNIQTAGPRGRASVSVFGWKGGSPLQASPLRPVINRNCVAARRGGEQRKVKKSSVG